MAENAVSTDLSDRNARYRGIVSPDKLGRIQAYVIGAGAIGRKVALALAEMGAPSITIVDFDTVSAENLGTQGYKPWQIGEPKALATMNDCRDHYGEGHLAAFNTRFTVESATKIFELADPKSKYQVVFPCVDSIPARRCVWDYVRDRCDGVLIDGRMAAMVCRFLTAKFPDPHSPYSGTLSEEDVPDLPCTERSTGFMAGAAANVMVALMVQWMRRQPHPADTLMDLTTFRFIGPETTRGFADVDEPGVLAVPSPELTKKFRNKFKIPQEG